MVNRKYSLFPDRREYETSRYLRCSGLRSWSVLGCGGLRAILKASNLCALEPNQIGHTLVDRGVTKSYNYAAQTMKEVPYGKWREYEPADTVRFYALRLCEDGLIKSTPQKILAQGIDWRFFNEFKKELKG